MNQEMDQEMTPSVTVRAAAKVNLHLGVGRPRPDGYHPLATVYQTLSLHDDVTVRTGPEWAVDLVCEDDIDRAAFPAGEANIVVQAGRLLVAHHGIERAAEVTVRKSIPIAGGLAGGSADAAAALVALDRLWDLQTSDEDLLAMAGALGSDVPFALVGGTALGGGRGEVVTPMLDEATRWWVVVPSFLGPVHPGGLPALRRALARRSRGGERPRRARRRAGRPRQPGPGRGPGQRPRRTQRSTCVPSSAS